MDNGIAKGESPMCHMLFRSRWLVVAAYLLNVAAAAFADSAAEFAVQGDLLEIRRGGQTLTVSLMSPEFRLDPNQVVGSATPEKTSGDLAKGETLEVTYAPRPLDGDSSLEVKLTLRWSDAEGVLRKWAGVRLVGAAQSRLLTEVVLERIDLQGRTAWTEGEPGKELPSLQGPESQPVFMPGLFVGVEFPVAFNRCEQGRVVLAHRPGVRFQPGAWYETRTAVYGLTPPDEEVPSFRRYIASHRPNPQGFHVNYNSWWTSPSPYTEADILTLMDVFAQEFGSRGGRFDSFCIDMGWSNAKSIWEIDEKSFPAGFSRIQEAARKMQSNLGLWLSPSSYYPPALDGDWAEAQGYETHGAPPHHLLCLGGPRYAERFKARLADLADRYGISQFKLDGYAAMCPEGDHGHAPGDLSAEPTADGIIAAMEAARKANPNVWIETTCFGWHASPWWLFHANSALGAHGDDAPHGKCPSPVYRESYTSARDFFNLQGAYWSPNPAVAQEVLGIIHQTPEPFLNDAVMTIMRGHMFVSLYVNPRFMSDTRWSALAGLLRWARENANVLAETVPLLPVSWEQGGTPHFLDDRPMPREPYGYAHVKDNRGLIVLRNPWIAPQSYALKLDRQLGFSPAAGGLAVVSQYPEPRRYGQRLKFGDTLDVALAPYETVVLAIDAADTAGDVPQASDVIGKHLRVDASDHRLERVAFQDTGKPFGPDWTCRLGDVSSAVRLTCNAKVHVAAPQAELLLLYEGERSPATPVGRLTINGREVEMQRSSSVGRWAASTLPPHEHWLFLRTPLDVGDNTIALEQFIGSDCMRVSAWVWATKPGEATTSSNALPQPELISLDGATLLPMTDLASLPAEAVRVERPVDRIDGVYLDTLTPVSVSQGYGTLQNNRSVWEKPMMIGDRPFLRGLGTHAPSKIVYALDGKYRRFQAWAGADANTGPSVTFEVLVDGVSKWQSGLMTRETPAAWVEVDVSGAKSLELVVGDAGNATSDHADWAEARLLR